MITMLGFTYRVYGLGVRSFMELPELQPAEAGEEIVIERSTIEPWPEILPGKKSRFEISEGEARLAFEGVGAFIVREGGRIIVDPAPGVEERVLRLFILGSALGILLHQRGMTTLHAGAVARDGVGVAFLGESGWGKSTMVGAFQSEGWDVLADDITVVGGDAGAPMILAGFPQLKLWPDAAEALGHAPEDLPLLHPRLEKRALRTPERFTAEPARLHRLYILARGAGPRVEDLTPQEALVELIRHSYAISLLKAKVTADSHLIRCAGLIGVVPVRRLHTGNSLATLSDVLRVVVHDVGIAE